MQGKLGHRMAPPSVPSRRTLVRFALAAALALVCLAGWGRLAGYVHRETGLFYWVGTDFALYAAQARAYLEGPPAKIYRQRVITRHYRDIVKGHSDIPRREMRGTHLPYPPIFAALFSPLARLPPLTGFAVWTALNLLACALLVGLAVRELPAGARPWAGVLFAASYPVAYPILLGQVQLFLACAVAGFFLLLRARRDFLAGLCLSLLVLKPHYALLLAVVLVWKRRWRVVAGGALGLAATLLASLLVSDLSTLAAYPGALRSLAGFRAGFYTHMVGWRSLVLFAAPEIDATTGFRLTLALGLVTAAAALSLWVRPWSVESRSFAPQVGAALIAVLLASTHSHAYGPAILVVPLAAVLGDARTHWLSRASVVGLFLVPTVAVLLIDLADVERASLWLALFLVSTLGALASEVWRADASPAEAA